MHKLISWCMFRPLVDPMSSGDSKIDPRSVNSPQRYRSIPCFQNTVVVRPCPLGSWITAGGPGLRVMVAEPNLIHNKGKRSSVVQIGTYCHLRIVTCPLPVDDPIHQRVETSTYVCMMPSCIDPQFHRLAVERHNAVFWIVGGIA